MSLLFDESVEDQQNLQKILRTSQIIVGALISGILMFLTITVLLVNNNQPAPVGAQPMLTWLSLAMTVMMLPMWIILPKSITGSQVKSIAKNTWSSRQKPVEQMSDIEKLGMVFQTETVISAALLEGAAFFTLVAFLTEGQRIVLGGTGLMLLLLVVTFPTKLKLRAWLQEQHAALQLSRGSSDSF